MTFCRGKQTFFYLLSHFASPTVGIYTANSQLFDCGRGGGEHNFVDFNIKISILQTEKIGKYSLQLW